MSGGGLKTIFDQYQSSSGSDEGEDAAPISLPKPQFKPVVKAEDDTTPRGNWPTFIYINYATNSGIKLVQNWLLDNLPFSNLHLVEDDLHVSLTKTIQLRYHWINLFVKTVKERLMSLNRFVIIPDELTVYCNETRTRTFLCLEIRTGYEPLHHIVQILNAALQEFKLPTFYQEPSFHISIAWCSGDQQENIQNELKTLKIHIEAVLSKCLEDNDNWYTSIDQIWCKCGNKEFKFNLI